MMNETIKAVSDATGVSIHDITASGGDRSASRARRIFMHLSHRLHGESLTSIAKFVGCTRQNVSQQLLNFEQDVRIYKGLKKQVEDIEKIILKESQQDAKPDGFPKIPYRKRR